MPGLFGNPGHIVVDRLVPLKLVHGVFRCKSSSAESGHAGDYVERPLHVAHLVVQVGREPDHVAAQRDPDAGLIQVLCHIGKVAAGKAGGNDGRTFVCVSGGSDLGADGDQAVDEVVGQDLVVGENPVDTRIHEVFDRFREPTGATVGHGAEFKPGRVLRVVRRIGADVPDVHLAPEPHQAGFQARGERWRKVHYGNTEGAAKPLVRPGGQGVDAHARRVDGDGARGLRGVHDQQGAVPVRDFREGGEIPALAAAEFNVGQGQNGRVVVHEVLDPVGIDSVSLRVSQTDLAARVIGYPSPGVHRGGKRNVGTDDIGIRTGHDRPGEGTQEFRGAGTRGNVGRRRVKKPGRLPVEIVEYRGFGFFVEVVAAVFGDVPVPVGDRRGRRTVHGRHVGRVDVSTGPGQREFIDRNQRIKGM